MNEPASGAPMAECNNLQRRRSPRLSSSLQAKSVSNMAPAVAIKRSITVRKIAPRKTVAPTEHNKENTPRLSHPSRQRETKVSTPSPECRVTPLKEQAAVLASPPPLSCSQQPAVDAQDAVWSQKARRSYSRLSDKSFNNSRENLFGFDKLQTPEIGHRDGQSRSGMEASGCLSGLASFTSLLEADDSASVFPELDPNIPGVVVVKEKKRRRRRKIQQIDTAELDALAATMNAEFEEAEGFELVVE